MATLLGNRRPNRITGTPLPDTILGLGGNDVIDGREDADELHGGNGIDTLSYAKSNEGVTIVIDDLSIIITALGGHAAGDIGSGFENITGSAFSDQLVGNMFANILRGGGVGDALNGNGGRDKLFGGNGADSLIGGAGADLLDGGKGLDLLNYQNSPDAVTIKLGKNGAQTVGKGGDAQGDKIKNVETIFGGNQDDHLTGNNLANNLVGRAGNDVLKGGGGNDRLTGQQGDDTLIGGKGDDTFAFFLGSGHDTIEDFTAGAGTPDRIEISASITLPNFDAVIAASEQVGADVVITLSDGNDVTIKNVLLADLHADDFSLI